jgi:hypothetical protein
MDMLKSILFSEYNGFADKRIKNLAKGSRFIIDDRSTGDFGADRGLLSYFCSIFADVISQTEVKVNLYGNVPFSSEVEHWVKKYNADYNKGVKSFLSCPVHKGREAILLELANAIASIVAPGAPKYDVPSYKYVCPRTANSLKRFVNVLLKAWGSL